MGPFMIKKVLVANRGEIAIRIFNTLHEMGIQAVAVFSEADAKALHVRRADEAVAIDSYLNAEAIIQAAKTAGAQAIHPGYGFLSENVKLSSACENSGIKLIGRRTDTIRGMGDKLESKRVMQMAGVPVVPSWETTPPDSEFPVLVKAVGGGGGKGMRLVEHPSQLAEAKASASREAGKAFGDDRVFVEKFVRKPRHIEFQVFGDTHGNVIHLFERECSIQRRHQKIVEETPSPALTRELRMRTGEAAVAAARAVEYVNAGTVEFILDPDGRFYFLEMNTRLQVEHPVTEAVLGLDLVRLQLEVAAGHPLPITQADVVSHGHALECRLYAEDTARGDLPSAGRILQLWAPEGPGVRFDSGVTTGSEVTVYYDPMLAKVITWGATRDEAIERMTAALQRTAV